MFSAVFSCILISCHAVISLLMPCVFAEQERAIVPWVDAGRYLSGFECLVDLCGVLFLAEELV